MAINFKQMFQNQTVMVIGGIAIIVAIIVITMLTGGSSDAPTSHKEPNWIMWVVLAILPLLALQIYGKGGTVVTAMISALALIAVVLLGNSISRSYTYGDKAEEVLQHQREVATKKALAEASVVPPTEPVRTIASPTWEKTAEDGSLPVNKWSESSFPPAGSAIKFDAGNCVAYKIRYKVYKSVWMDHDCKTDPSMTELQFMVLQKGIMRIPFTIIQ